MVNIEGLSIDLERLSDPAYSDLVHEWLCPDPEAPAPTALFELYRRWWRYIAASVRETASGALTRSCQLASAAEREDGPGARRYLKELSAHYGGLGVHKIREAELYEQAAGSELETAADVEAVAKLVNQGVAITEHVYDELQPAAIASRCAYWLPRNPPRSRIPRRRPCGHHRTRGARTGRRSHPTRAGPDGEDPDEDPPHHRDRYLAQHAARRLSPRSRTRRSR